MVFDAILALTDFSPQGQLAVMRAAALAQRHGCLLKIMYGPVEMHGALDAQVWRETSTRIASDIHARFGVLVKNVADTRGELEAVAEEARWVDLLVVGPGWGRADGSLWGGLRVERLQRVVPCPVLVARADGAAGYRRVVVAIDSAPDPATLLQLARSIGHDAGAVPVQVSAPTLGTPMRDRFRRAWGRAGGRPVPADTVGGGDVAGAQPRRMHAQLTVVGRGRRSGFSCDALCPNAVRQALERSSGDVLLVPHNLRLAPCLPSTGR